MNKNKEKSQELTKEEQRQLLSEYYSEMAKKSWEKRRQKFIDKALALRKQKHQQSEI